MTIKILEIKVIQNPDTGANESRHADIIISDDVTHYALGVGSLPIVGDLQIILDARKAELWGVAVAKNNQLITEEVRAELYESPLAGGWSNREFQEAVTENWAGRPEKKNRIESRREAIRAAWPL